MAKLTQRRSENVSGDFYVDSTCIDCDTCRWMMPSVFDRIGEQSAVHHQPVTDAEKLQAMQALLSCPTASIGTVEKPKSIKTAQASFPILITDKITDKILGAHMIGHEAGTVIHELSIAMGFGASSEDVARICHGHPTVNEAIKEAALATYSKAIHF